MHSLLEQQLNYRYVDDVADVRDVVIPAVRAADVVSLDIETTDLKSTRGCIRLMQFGIGDEQFVVDCFRVDATEMVAAIAVVPTLIIQNAAFEAEWLSYHHGWDFDLNRIFDTMAASWALKEKPASLGALVERRLGMALDKSKQVSDWTKTELDEEQLKYAALDVAVLPLLEQSLRLDLESQGLFSQYEQELREWVQKCHAKHVGFVEGRTPAEEVLVEKIVAALNAAEDHVTLEKYYEATWKRILRKGNRDIIRGVYEQRLQELLSN